MSTFYAEKKNEYPDIGQNAEPSPNSAASIFLSTKINPPRATCTTTSRKPEACATQYF